MGSMGSPRLFQVIQYRVPWRLTQETR